MRPAAHGILVSCGYVTLKRLEATIEIPCDFNRTSPWRNSRGGDSGTNFLACSTNHLVVIPSDAKSGYRMDTIVSTREAVFVLIRRELAELGSMMTQFYATQAN